MIPRRKLPPLNALRAFEVAGRHLNFRLASEELGVTQGAVAAQVRMLEAHLGRVLFTRQARGLALTAEGAAYLVEISAAFDGLARATGRLAQAPGRVTISATPTVAARVLVPRLAALTAALPGVELGTIAEEAIPDFDRDGVDIAIALARPPFAPGLESALLIPQELWAVASPSLASGLTLPLTSEALGALPLIHHCLDHWPRLLGRPAPRGPRFSLTTLAIEAAIAGQGLVLAARAFVAPEVAAGRLVRLDVGAVRVEPGYHLIRKDSVQPRPASDAVWDWCLKELSA